MRGFWAGRRSTYRKVTQNVRTPSNRLIRMTYSVPEKKFIDTTGTTNVPEVGTISLLNPLGQGTSVITRIGQKIVIRSIDLRVRVSAAPPSASPSLYPNMVRVLLVWDNQPNGALAAASDIIEDLTAGTGVIAPQQKIYISRFRILWDKKFMLSNMPTADGITSKLNDYDQYYKKTKLQVGYADSNNGDITDIITGAIYLLAIGQHTATANQGILEYFSRIRFYDN